MKRLFILTLAIVWLGVNQKIYAEIKNGYDNEVIEAQKKLGNLNEIAKGTLTKKQRMRLKKCLKAAHAFAENVQENYAKTQELIEKLRMIDPVLYDEINTIKDQEGNDTDIYVKVVDDLGPGYLGVTNVKQSASNPHVYTSRYGDHTVSVMVVYPRTIKALLFLVHELGHVRYQVPHLASYMEYYRNTYQNPRFNSKEIGHMGSDPSHQSVIETLKEFKASWRTYYRERKKIARNKSQKMLVSAREN